MVHRHDTDRINITAGTLDDTSFFKPTANIYCETKQSWVPLATDMRSYPASELAACLLPRGTARQPESPRNSVLRPSFLGVTTGNGTGAGRVVNRMPAPDRSAC
jgi:hypothetical protein